MAAILESDYDSDMASDIDEIADFLDGYDDAWNNSLTFLPTDKNLLPTMPGFPNVRASSEGSSHICTLIDTDIITNLPDSVYDSSTDTYKSMAVHLAEARISATPLILIDSGAPKVVGPIDYFEYHKWQAVITFQVPKNAPPFSYAGHAVNAISLSGYIARCDTSENQVLFLRVIAWVLPRRTPVPLLLGLDALQFYLASLNFDESNPSLSLGKHTIPITSASHL